MPPLSRRSIPTAIRHKPLKKQDLQQLRRQSRSGTTNAIEPVMGFRIDVASVCAKTRIIIAGQLLAEGVVELSQAAGANGGSLELDLSDLRFADSSGVEALGALIRKKLDPATRGGKRCYGLLPAAVFIDNRRQLIERK